MFYMDWTFFRMWVSCNRLFCNGTCGDFTRNSVNIRRLLKLTLPFSIKYFLFGEKLFLGRGAQDGRSVNLALISPHLSCIPVCGSGRQHHVLFSVPREEQSPYPLSSKIHTFQIYKWKRSSQRRINIVVLDDPHQNGPPRSWVVWLQCGFGLIAL